MRYAVLLLASVLLGALMDADAAVERRDDTFVLSGKTYSVEFSARDGSIVALREAGKAGAILRSGEHGLWRAQFRDGSQISGREFGPSGERAFSCRVNEAANTLQMGFRGPDITVLIAVVGREGDVEFGAQVTPREKTVLDFALPARLRFEPDAVERFITPMNGNSSVGTAFNSAFFKLQPQDKPAGWRPRLVGPAGYAALYGASLDQREDQDPPTTLSVTEEGREWFGEALTRRVDGASAVVNRPPFRDQANLILADSPNGPYFSASHLGGAGFLWRIGGGVGNDEKRNAADMVMAAIEKLAEAAPAGRNKLGLVSLERGPDRGGWSAVTVREWQGMLGRRRAVASRKAQVIELTTPTEMMDGLAPDDFLVIINPYGEWTPVLEEGGMEETVAAVGRYVRAGGNWFEVGGYPFYYEMLPLRYLSYGTSYPAGFADFHHLDTEGGAASIYGIQPQKWQPWEGARNKEAIFVPGHLSCGADQDGGYCDREFATFVAPGETWRSPTVRLAVGSSAPKDLREYCRANHITRRLEDKMSPEVLDKFKNSVLVYYAGTCKDKIEHLELLPTPTQIHFADYLRGGFDKQYPDHLPPRDQFGAAEEFHEFFDRCHELGHLVMPYTNPTWWCDKPKGPTFEREGEAPLLRKLDGGLSHERYASNVGFTVCHWHPAVQAANRETVRLFTEEYPVDILFQDQCGARGWRYDTNPASPTPYAYSDGLISMVAEDCKTKPLSTESGWDRVVNYESQLCGMSWAIVPTEGGPSWRKLMKYDYPPETWAVFPLAQYIAHDKTAMLYHDLGQFVTNREVLSWTLGLGFCMSYRLSAAALTSDVTREWLRWLDRMQKSVCARYVGEPVEAFEHDRGPNPTLEDDGVIRATYGQIEVVANLGPKARREGDRELPPFGFYVTGPELIAANLKSLGGQDSGEEGISFVAEGKGEAAQAWVYAPQDTDVRIELPEGGKTVRLRTPHREGEKRVEPPPALAGKAPRDWPGDRPAVGILDVGEGINPSWTRITPADWANAFGESRLATEFGVPVRRISTAEALVSALQAGPTRWLAIINPYGEGFPSAGEGKWREMLDKIRDYVNNGGCWWETGGYSFYHSFFPQAGGWAGEHVDSGGMGYLGLPVGGGEVDAPAERLSVPAEGRQWLGDDLSEKVQGAMSAVNRGLTRGSDDPGHVALVAGERQDFIGGYRLDGWGWLWRIGGFYPNAQVALPVAVAAMERIFTHLPEEPKAGGVRYLWHATPEAVEQAGQKPGTLRETGGKPGA